MIPCLSSAEAQRSPFATLIPSAGLPAHIIGLFKMDYFYSSTIRHTVYLLCTGSLFDIYPFQVIKHGFKRILPHSSQLAVNKI